MKKRPARSALFVVIILMLVLSLAGCGGASGATAAAASASEPSAAAQSAAAQPASAQSVAMADSPQRIAPQQYQEQFAAGQTPFQLIDVRTPEEFASGHIAGSVNIPVESLSDRLGEVSQDSPVVLYCRSGRRSAEAARILDAAGYNGVYDLGGIQAWQAAGFPVEQ